MVKPLNDDAAGRPPSRSQSGCNPLFFAIFLLLLAVVGYIAWQRSPPDAPNPAATAQPDVVGQPS